MAEMDEKRCYIFAVLTQLIYTGNYIVSKAAFNGGMPTTVFVFYRQAIASFCVFPFAITFESKTAPRMSLRIFVKIFFLATLGVACSLNLFNLGIKYTSSTVASAVTNAVPVVTFALAVLLRIESVKLKEATGIAKVFGIVLCLAGVLVLAFYEGPHLKPMSHDRPILHQSNSKQGSHSKSEWIIGTFVMILSAVTWSLWIILQGPILNQYPSKLMFSATCNFLGTIQSFFVALVAERDFNKWKLHFDDGLLGVSYNVLSGTICIGHIVLFASMVHREKRGSFLGSVATFVSAHYPGVFFILSWRNNQLRKCLRRTSDGWRPIQCLMGKRQRKFRDTSKCQRPK